MKILCTIITGTIKDLAKQLGRSESYTCNLVSVWQTKNQSAAYPTVEDLKALLEANKEEAWDTYFAVPNYNVIEYNAKEIPIKHDGNKITLMKLPSNNPLEYFYNMYKHLPNLRNLVKTTEEAYRFILWREMAFMQYGLDKKVENRPFTEGIALKKMEEWRKKHPVSIQTTQQPVQQNLSEVPASYEGMITPDANTIFVFGSNPEGRHGAGAAKTAKEKFGAIYGQGEGLQGNSYALPTKDLRVKENRSFRSISPEQITENIKKMYEVAKQNSTKQFKVAYTHGLNEKSLNGYTGAEMIRMFKNAGPIPSNVVFSKNWTDHWDEVTGGVSANQNSSTDEVVVKSFGSELVNANNGTTNTKETVTKEEAENVHKVPMIGTDVLQVNRDTPFAKLTREFTTMERRDRVEMLARRFSDVVDQAVQNKLTEIANAITEAKQEGNDAEVIRLHGKLALFNDSTLGRKAAIEEITLEEIFSTMKEEIEEYANMTEEEADEDYGEGQGAHIINAYQKILNNWEALLEETRPIIEKNENLKIIVNTHSFNTGTDVTEVVGGTVTDSTQDEDQNEEENYDDVEGKRVEGHEGWSYKARFIDPAKTLSKGVKKILSNLKREGIDGQIEVDDLGNFRYLDAEVAHAALINELSNMVLPNDFSRELEDGTYEFPALTEVAKKYPWANQIINALQADPTLISSFYADFRKDYIPYWGQIYDEAEEKWKCIQLNAPVALDSMRDAIIRNYDQGVKLDEDSVYDGGGVIKADNATVGLNLTNDTLSMLRDFDEDDTNILVSNMNKGLRMLGVNTTPSVITSLLAQENAFTKIGRILNSMRNIFEGIPKMEEDSHLIEVFSSDYNIIAEEIGLVSELDNTSTFRANGKTYPSYSAPNYLDTMFKMFKNDKYRAEYLEREFGRYEWFKKDGKWRSEWLRLIESDEDVRHHLELKEVNSIGGMEYTEWTPSLIKNSFIREYFSVGYNKGSKKQYAYYNMPIFSDSPVAKFIKAIRYTSDARQHFTEKLLPLFNQVVKQEISRIKLIQDRRAANATEISNFDKNGAKFHFFPKLNDEKGFTEEVMALTKAGDLNGLNALINTTINKIMQEDFEEFLQTNFTKVTYEDLRQDLLNEGAITSEEQFEEALKEYFWNQAYATTQIIELTTTDLAFYKDSTDFQKRYKEVYAAGTKLNTNSKFGRQTERTVYLEDQIVTSSSFADIKKSLDRAVELHHIQSFDRDNILNKFKDINVADAQAYRSLSSMRAVLDMMGAWTPSMAESMERIQSGKWDMKDFNTVWQTIKPFVFTQVEKPNGLGGIMKVPHQNKNSEFLLLAAYQVVATSMGKSAKLRALDKFMEANNIDVIQFESAVKAGKQSPINISYSAPKLDVWKLNNPKEWEKLTKHSKESKDIKIFKEGNDYLLDKGLITQEEYNSRFEEIEPNEQEVYDTLTKNCFDNGQLKPDVVHELPYSDYVVQQPTPEHLFDHKAVFGSQFRNLIISDMPDDPDFRVKVNGVEFTKKEVMNLYQANIVENLLEDWKDVKGRFADIHSLQKALIAAVKSNSKYGNDMLNALQLVEVENPTTTNEKELVFNIPLDNPTTTSQIQELVTSMFKNAITKQKIKGASCILVSDFGLTKELHVLHGEQGEITGIECYLPAYSKKFYAPFAVTKKTADGEEYQELDVQKMPIELRRLIGYRIPTEDKYSMAPLIVKGFLPQQNGSAIMLPADITQIAGSDFDVDKMFLMIPEFKTIKEYNIKSAWDTFYKENPEITSQIKENQWNAFRLSYQKILESNPKEAELIDVDDEEFLRWFVKESGMKQYEWANDVKEAFSKWFENNKARFYKGTKISKIEYDFTKPAQDQPGRRQARNNVLIDIAYGILTHPDTAEKIHNPGNFDKAKIAARIATIASSDILLTQFADKYGLDSIEAAIPVLLRMSQEGNLEALDKFIKDTKKERSQLTLDTFIYNHRQNMTGGALIGMYANNTTMQAKLQVSDLSIKGQHVFTINGRNIQSLHNITSALGERISKNCANFSAASVDNVKDPVLADLMQNTQTANIAGFMLRAGMSIEEIGLLFSQPMVRNYIEATGGLSGFDRYADAAAKQLKQDGGGVDTNILKHDFTSEELMNNIVYEHLLTGMSKEDVLAVRASQIQAALLMAHISEMAKEMSALTQIARADSPNGAIDISIAGAKTQVRKVTMFNRRAKDAMFHLSGANILRNKYVNPNMSIDQLRTAFLKSKTPMLQAFYSLGIEMGTNVMSQYFSQTTPYSNDMVDKIFDNSQYGIVKPEMLNKYYNELVEFALSKTKMFGDDGTLTFDEKRDYYLYDFPSDFMAMLADNPDIANMGIIRKMHITKDNIELRKSGRLSTSMKETLMRDFDRLLTMENPVAQRLAIDLFMYSYYKDGFKFGPNNFGTFFSTTFIAAFPEVVNALRTMRYEMKEGSYFDRFLPQFYANHCFEGLVPLVNDSSAIIKSKDGKIAVPSKYVLNKNLITEGKIGSFPYITFSAGGFYSLVSDGKEMAVYQPAVSFTTEQKSLRGVKYNANMTAQEMSSIIPDASRVAAATKAATQSYTSYNDDDFSYDDQNTNIKEFTDLDDATLDSTDRDSENYDAEDYDEAAGEATLDEPLCIK